MRINERQVAINFYELLIDMGYRDSEDFEEDIDEVIEDFKTMKAECPKMFNLLRDISDR